MQETTSIALKAKIEADLRIIENRYDKGRYQIVEAFYALCLVLRDDPDLGARWEQQVGNLCNTANQALDELGDE